MNDLDFMEAVTNYMTAATEGQQATNRLLFAIIDQITELTERTNDPDLMAGWSARLAMVSEKEL